MHLLAKAFSDQRWTIHRVPAETDPDRGGADLIQQYLNAGVVDELIISLAP
jgi:riboflavin biosynthesis pyrimidine reductase